MIAAGCFLILSFAAGFHAYWALGGRKGYAVAIPQFADGRRVFEPSPKATFVVAGLILTAGLWVLASASAFPTPLPLQWLRWGTAAMAAVFLYRATGPSRFAGLLKTVKGTEFARFDTSVYCPLCFVLASGLACVAAGV